MLVLAAAGWMLSAPAQAQNDWQYPDPFFGSIQFERQAGERGVWSRGLPRPQTDRDAAPEGPEAAATERMFRERRPWGWRRWRRRPRAAQSRRSAP